MTSSDTLEERTIKLAELNSIREGSLAPEAAVARLIELLDDEEPDVCAEAVAAAVRHAFQELGATKVAAGVIPALDGRAIIVQRAHNPGKGLWTFPGGFVNRGEVVSEAAVREAMEEAGVEVKSGPLMGVYSFPGNPTILIVYAGEVVGGEPRPLAESTDLRLVGPDEIPYEELAFDTTRAAFRDWQAWMSAGK